MSARRLLVALGVVLSLFFTYLAVRDVDADLFWKGLRESTYWWLIPASLALAAVVYVRAVRWCVLFTEPTRPSVGAAIRATLVGQLFNSILPMRAGEAARIVYLHEEAGTSRAEALGTAVVERVYDFLGLFLLLLVAAPFLPEVGWLRAAVVFGVLLGLGTLVASALLDRYGVRVLAALLWPFALLPRVTRDRTDRAAANLAHGLSGFRLVRLALPAFVLTVLAWLLTSLSFWFVMVGFSLDLSPGAGLLVVVATAFALLIPSLPAALGIFEAATVVSLRAYGIDDSRALSCAVVLHALTVFPFIAAGYVVLHGHARRRRA